MVFSYFAHRRDCRIKQDEREKLVLQLDEPLWEGDSKLLNKSVAEVVAEVQSGQLDPVDVLSSYSRKAVQAHFATNCLTEILAVSARAYAKSCNRQGSLAGMPVSLKDTFSVKGWDNCLGYSAMVGKPAESDSALVRLLRDAGAVPFVKTNIPITLLSFESNNDVFGRSTNPHNENYSPGGSTGGEAALLAFGGSRIGVGTDVSGSVRVPAHYSGCYAVKCSNGRFPKAGNATSVPGQDRIPAVSSPMARTLEDLEYFWKAVVDMKPWEYDYTCVPMPWVPFKAPEGRKLRWGVMRSDGIIAMSPACERALDIVVDTLRRNGHEVFDVAPPNPYQGHRIASQLVFSDAARISAKPARTFEFVDIGVAESIRMLRLPNILRKLYVFYLRYIRRDEIYAGFVDGWYTRSSIDICSLTAQREAFKASWFKFWNEQELDFMLSAPNSLPAIPHGGMKQAWKACGYSVLFNLLDYAAGVLPVTKVNAKMDKLPKSFKPSNNIEAGMYKLYDAEAMHGLPVGVQVIGKRLEEEKVLEGMKIVEGLLKKEGRAYELIPV